MGRSLIVIFAHPDDESFGVGGTLGKYAAQGTGVTLVCATSGEEGEISDPTLATPENLGEVRREELRCACRTLGMLDPILLGYRDSGMAGTEANRRPEAFINANAGEVVGKLVHLIRVLKPQVLVTFEPGGIYGHPDHVAISRFATEAFNVAGDPTCYPEQIAEGLSPHRPHKLYYTVAPRDAMRKIAERLAEMGPDVPFQGMDWEHFGTPDEEITTVLDIQEYLEAKMQAIRCHRTQLQTLPMLDLMPEGVRREFLGMETFVLAYPAPQKPIASKETDLFDGLGEMQ
ncbi:MAG: PIG-L family deacetylase [Chloroflexi bacterium]|nr:PIG-L family deacetylase [Chloroflexota bacterium]